MSKNKLCWDCLHFKTREYNSLKDIKAMGRTGKLAMEIQKAKKEDRKPRYFKCDMHQTSNEFYTLLSNAKTMKACEQFNDMDEN